MRVLPSLLACLAPAPGVPAPRMSRAEMRPARPADLFVRVSDLLGQSSIRPILDGLHPREAKVSVE